MVDPFAPLDSGKDRVGPVPIKLQLPEGLGGLAADNATAKLSGLSGKTLSMQLLPGGEVGVLQLVFWTLSNSTWACGNSCPSGVVSGR